MEKIKSESQESGSADHFEDAITSFDSQEKKNVEDSIMSHFFGSIEFFSPGGDFDSYAERLDQLLAINKITEDKLQGSFLITLMRPETYKIAKLLVAPAEPHSKGYKELINILKSHFKPKANIIAERFQFHK